MLIAVAPHERVRGVAEPNAPAKPCLSCARKGTQCKWCDPGGSSDWRHPPGTLENTRRILPEYDVTHVSGALSRTFPTDAHFVAYVLRSGGVSVARQPRIRKEAIDWVREQGFELSIGTLCLDLDRSGHEPWASEADAIAGTCAVKGCVPTAIVYASRAGVRIIQPLRVGLAPEAAEGALAAYLAKVESLSSRFPGLQLDRDCLDWTRHFRLPNVVRRGVGLMRSAKVFHDCEPIEAPAPIAVARRSRARKKATPAGGAIAWSTSLPEHLAPVVADLAAAMPTHGPSWHETHLALAGALAARGVEPGHLPQVALGIAHASADSKADDRQKGAIATARRYVDGAQCLGRVWLEANAPALAAVLDAHFGRAKPSAKESLPEAPTDSPAVVGAQIHAGVSKSGDGLSLIVVPCGTGKTFTLRGVAAERAAKTHATPGEHTRAPLDSKTCIAVPTHELAIQIQTDLEAAGVPTARVFGIASVKNDDGTPVCHFAEQAKALAAGGLSARLELCEGRGEPCMYRATCKARAGVAGSEDARVFVGPHALVHDLDARAGTTGILAIDEPPELLRTERFSVADLDHALLRLDRFAARFAAAMRPAVLAARTWVAMAPPEGYPPGHLSRAWAAGADPHALEVAFDATGATSVEEAVANAVAEDATSSAPALASAYEASRARKDPNHARDTGKAARVLRDIRLATTTRSYATVEGGHLVLTLIVEGLRRAVSREGRCVVLAADADLHAPLLAAAVGYEPPLLKVAARFGCPIRRLLLETRATRGRWLPAGVVNRERVMEALRAGVAELEREGARESLVVSWLAVEESLRKDAEAVALLARVGASWGHYGGLRGLDRWKGVDAVLTLGDPRPNFGDVSRGLVAMTGAQPSDADVSARADALAAAELEQADGRARPIHRTAPLLLVHVGEVRPRGWCTPVEVRPMSAAPGEALASLKSAVEIAGGSTAAARVLGVDRRTVNRWLEGQRAIPSDAIDRLDLVNDHT